MAWGLPSLPSAGDVATVTGWAAKVINCLRYLKGLDGVPTIASGLIIDNADGDEYLKLPLLSTAEAASVLDAEGEVAFDEQTHTPKYYNGSAVKDLGDHGNLGGLGDDDHTIYVLHTEVDDSPVDGVTTDPISSNWAFDHGAAADPHAGYMLESIIDAAGDIIYGSADNAIARLAKGTAGQYLKIGASIPEWAAVTGILSSKVKSETRDLAAASGDVSYTGYGIQPTCLIAFGCISGSDDVFSLGIADSAIAEQCIIQTYTPVYEDSGAIFIKIDHSSGNRQQAVVKTYDVDGHTDTWVKTGSPTGTIAFKVLALK